MRRKPQKDTGLGASIACSLLVHAFLIAVFTFFGSFATIRTASAPVYYVDLINLPVANPQAGSPAARGETDALPDTIRAHEEMRIPLKTPSSKPAAVTKQAKNQQRSESDKEFQQRLARLETKVEGRHAEAAIDALRKKVAQGTGRAGMPGGTGSEAGSDYGSYIQSRLRDAFGLTITTRSKNPSVVVRLTIDRFGKLVGYRIERSTGDKVFEDSVTRAVKQAEETFPPPPGGKEFKQGFIFKPEGVGKK